MTLPLARCVRIVPEHFPHPHIVGGKTWWCSGLNPLYSVNQPEGSTMEAQQHKFTVTVAVLGDSRDEARQSLIRQLPTTTDSTSIEWWRVEDSPTEEAACLLADTGIWWVYDPTFWHKWVLVSTHQRRDPDAISPKAGVNLDYLLDNYGIDDTEKQIEEPERHVVLYGEVGGIVNVAGPFDTNEDAISWAEGLSQEWNIRTLEGVS